MFDDGWFLNLALLALAVIVSGPAALILVLRQRQRIAALEARLARLESGAPRPAETAPERVPMPAAPVAAPAPPPPPVSPLATVPAIPVASPPPRPGRPGIEERFGTRWTVWIGGLALALGAALLVRYSAERGLFGPGVRVVSALLLGLGLIAAGEALRRRLREANAVPTLRPDIPAMVSAAGIVALFGTAYAAHALYGFIGPEIAFAGLGLTGGLAMLAALLHGPALAGLGLVGALATPLLVGGSGSPWPLTLYLPMVAAAAYGFAWARGWWGLGVAAGLGAAGWSVVLGLAASGPSEAAAALLHLVLQQGLAALVFAWLPHRRPDEAAAPDPAAGGALAAGALTGLAVLAPTAVLAGPGGPPDTAWIVAAGAVVAIPAFLGLLRPANAAGLAAAGLALCAALVLWPEIGPSFADAVLPEAVAPGWLLAFAGLGAGAILAAGALRLIGGSGLPRSGAFLYAGAAALTPLAVLGLADLRIAGGAVSPGFAAAAGGLAVGMTGLAAMARREAQAAPSPALVLALGSFASAAVAAVALGLVFAVSGGSLVVAVALAAAGTAAIAHRLDIPALRWCVGGLGLVVAARLAWDPTVVGPSLSRTPVFNGLLLGYGVPALAFAAAGRLIRLPGRAPDAPHLVVQALGLVLAAFLIFFEIRHAVHDGDLFASETGLTEQGLLTLSGLAFALVLTRLDGLHASPVLRWAGLAFGAVAFVQGALCLGVFANPLFSGEPVAGGLLVNEIAAAYGLPAAAALALARTARGTRPRWYLRGATLLGLGLGFLGVSLLIRHGFQGAQLGFWRETGEAEWYAYSAGWLIAGLLLLAYGILRGSLPARRASAGLVGLSILKVFLFDLAGLDGPLRALSFLGLGAVLIGIGLVYQRYVFALDRGPAAPEG